MRLLSVAITVYIMGLLTFYVAASFNTKLWDIAYFGWDKVADCGILFWWFLYSIPQYKRIVKWLFVFSIIRFIFDVQYVFTGISVNNEVLVAFLFLILIIIVGVLTLREGARADRVLSKTTLP